MTKDEKITHIQGCIDRHLEKMNNIIKGNIDGIEAALLGSLVYMLDQIKRGNA